MSNTVLMELIDELKSNIRDALIASDIWEGGKGESLAGYNAQPVATKLFDDFHSFLESNLTTSKFPPLARYFLLELEDNNAVVVLN